MSVSGCSWRFCISPHPDYSHFCVLCLNLYLLLTKLRLLYYIPCVQCLPEYQLVYTNFVQSDFTTFNDLVERLGHAGVTIMYYV